MLCTGDRQGETERRFRREIPPTEEERNKPAWATFERCHSQSQRGRQRREGRKDSAHKSAARLDLVYFCRCGFLSALADYVRIPPLRKNVSSSFGIYISGQLELVFWGSQSDVQEKAFRRVCFWDRLIFTPSSDDQLLKCIIQPGERKLCVRECAWVCLSVQARAVRQVSPSFPQPSSGFPLPGARTRHSLLLSVFFSDFLSGGVISLIAWSQLLQRAWQTPRTKSFSILFFKSFFFLALLIQ